MSVQRGDSGVHPISCDHWRRRRDGLRGIDRVLAALNVEVRSSRAHVHIRNWPERGIARHALDLIEHREQRSEDLVEFRLHVRDLLRRQPLHGHVVRLAERMGIGERVAVGPARDEEIHAAEIDDQPERGQNPEPRRSDHVEARRRRVTKP